MLKTKYAMENQEEAQRLEQQALLPAYQIQEELRGFKPKKGERILDAGCGSGLLARHLAKSFPETQVEACDFSSDRISSAQEIARDEKCGTIRFFESDLTQIQSEDQRYNHVICRFVLEHNRKPENIVRELKRILKPGGQIRLIDWDGIVLNLHPASSELQSMLNTIEQRYPGDLRVGRKMPDLLQKEGFRGVSWRVEAMSFQGESLLAEVEQTEQRLAFAQGLLSQIFDSELMAKKFRKLYCQEMQAPGSTLFYNKFVANGIR